MRNNIEKCKWISLALAIGGVLAIAVGMSGCGDGKDGADGKDGVAPSGLQGKIAYMPVELPESTDCFFHVDRSFKRTSKKSTRVKVYTDHSCNDFSGVTLSLKGNATYSAVEGLYLLQGTAKDGITLTHYCW